MSTQNTTSPAAAKPAVWVPAPGDQVAILTGFASDNHEVKYDRIIRVGKRDAVTVRGARFNITEPAPSYNLRGSDRFGRSDQTYLPISDPAVAQAVAAHAAAQASAQLRNALHKATETHDNQAAIELVEAAIDNYRAASSSWPL